MKPFPLTAAGIQARLRAMEKERAALIELHRVYVAHGDPVAPSLPADRKGPQIVAAEASSPAPGYKPTRFISRAAVNGTTEAIHAVVGERPGIQRVDLINEVLRRVSTSAKKPRKNIANIARAQVKAGKLASRQGGFYPVPA